MKKILIACLTLVCALTVAFGFGTTKKANADGKFLKEVNVTLTDGIDVNYYVSGANDYDTAVIDFTYCGDRTKRITERITDGSATITFKGLAPQYMTEKVVATLTLKSGETEGATETKEFSLQSYVKSVLALEKKSEQTVPEYAAMRTLAVDLLYYGDEAMKYVETETVAEEKLATAVLSEEEKALKTTATATDESEYAEPADNTNENFRWVSYGARFDNKLGVYFEFIAKSVDNLKIKFSSGAEVTEFETRTETIGESEITVYKAVNELFATDYANVVTANAYSGDTEIGSAITYSVRSLTADFGANTHEYALALSACAYGEAAANYKNVSQIATDSFTTLSSVGEQKVDVEKFDPTNLVFDWRKPNDGAYCTETTGNHATYIQKTGEGIPTNNGKAVVGLKEGTEINTTLRIIENSTIKITFLTSDNDGNSAGTNLYYLKDNWKFYVDGKELTLVERKNVKSGPANGVRHWDYHYWIETELGIYNIPSGNHVFTAKIVTGSAINLDCFSFDVISCGTYDASGVDLDNQGKRNYDVILNLNDNYKLEAEDIEDTSTWVKEADSKGFIEYWTRVITGEDTVRRTGYCVANTTNKDKNGNSSIVVIKVKITKACKIKIAIMMSASSSAMLTAREYLFNGEKITLTPEKELTQANNDWYNFIKVESNEISVAEAGIYEFRLPLGNANTDCFVLTTSAL